MVLCVTWPVLAKTQILCLRPSLSGASSGFSEVQLDQKSEKQEPLEDPCSLVIANVLLMFWLIELVCTGLN